MIRLVGLTLFAMRRQVVVVTEKRKSRNCVRHSGNGAALHVRCKREAAGWVGEGRSASANDVVCLKIRGGKHNRSGRFKSG